MERTQGVHLSMASGGYPPEAKFCVEKRTWQSLR
jgi:hypothetical protein